MHVNQNATRIKTTDPERQIQELRDTVAKQAARIEALEKRVPAKPPEGTPKPK
jgi:hypothetical protein